MTTRATAADAGCWIDGHWGQYGPARLVLLAEATGYPGQDGDIGIALRHMDECAHPGTDNRITDDEYEILADTDPVEDWLNENVAPEGFYFGWYDGEFFLNGHAWWDDEEVPGE